MKPYALTRTFWRIVLGANWIVILWFWWEGSASALGESAALTLVALGRLAGVSAAYFLLRQFFLMGRLPWMERAFGLDQLSRMHHRNGRWALILLVAHPVLMASGFASAAGIGYFRQQWMLLTDYPYVIWGVIGLTLFVIVAGTSIFLAIRKRFRYEAWYFIHILAYLAIASTFWHQVNLGGYRWYWIGLYAAVFANHLVFRFARPIYNYFRYGFYVSRIVRETPSTVSVHIGGSDLASFNIHPGQFMILRFFTKKLWWQAHPFSLSMMPDGKELRVTIKNVGDFTGQVPAIPVGTKIMIDGPYGIFTEFFSISPKVLFIAGGIGITPIRSLMEAMARHKKDVALLYSNRTERDIVFKKELEDVAAAHGGKVTHVISDDPNYSGEKGRLDKEKIRRLVPDIAEREVYLCGPVPMMNAIRQALTELGLAPAKIHYEEFSLQ